MRQSPNKNTVGMPNLRRVIKLEPVGRAEKFLEDHSRLKSCKVGTNAEMGATPEAHMVSWMGSIELQLLGLVINSRVPIRSGPEQHESIARLQGKTAQLAGATNRAVVEFEGRLKPQDLLDESRDPCRFATKLIRQLRVFRQQTNRRPKQCAG